MGSEMCIRDRSVTLGKKVSEPEIQVTGVKTSKKQQDQANAAIHELREIERSGLVEVGPSATARSVPARVVQSRESREVSQVSQNTGHLSRSDVASVNDLIANLQNTRQNTNSSTSRTTGQTRSGAVYTGLVSPPQQMQPQAQINQYMQRRQPQGQHVQGRQPQGQHVQRRQTQGQHVQRRQTQGQGNQNVQIQPPPQSQRIVTRRQGGLEALNNTE